MVFPRDQETGLSIIPLGSPLLFNLPPTLNISSKERRFLDTVWANNKHPSSPAILTKFANYLQHKNLLVASSDINLGPKSLHAYLEL